MVYSLGADTTNKGNIVINPYNYMCIESSVITYMFCTSIFCSVKSRNIENSQWRCDHRVF